VLRDNDPRLLAVSKAVKGHRDIRSTRRYAMLKNEGLLEVVRPRTLH